MWGNGNLPIDLLKKSYKDYFLSFISASLINNYFIFRKIKSSAVGIIVPSKNSPLLSRNTIEALPKQLPFD